mmetsp:Transcript_30730/g.61776  ORF Transcript_30730/g.61776 Transcript_30730/m.61776 type:complete len:114 (-) Transcript_30730:146-487(-)
MVTEERVFHHHLLSTLRNNINSIKEEDLTLINTNSLLVVIHNKMVSSNNLNNSNGVEALAGIKMVTMEITHRKEEEEVLVGLIGGKTQEIKYGGDFKLFCIHDSHVLSLSSNI